MGMLVQNIEKCTFDQVHLLQKLAIKTYQETFAESNSDDLLQQYYKKSLNIAKLSAQLENTNSEFYFIYSAPRAEPEAKLAGFLKLNIDDAQTDLLDPDALEVEKIYILKGFLSQGLGKQMISFAINRAQQNNKKYLWLGVWENNFSALNFYKKMGFEQFGEHGFDMAGDIQTDLLLRKDL
jgi:ribosomal protein S18 acetylase RimI-like enzyme